MSRFHLCSPPLHLGSVELSAVALSVSGLALSFDYEDDDGFLTVDPRLQDTFESERIHLRRELKKDSILAKPKRLETEGKRLKLVGSPVLFSDSLALKRSIWASQLIKELTPEDFRQPLPGLAGAAGMHLGVISAEGKMLCVRRSSSVAVYPNQWVPTLLEGLTPEDFKAKDPRKAGLRALEEELGVWNAPLKRIKLLAVLVGHQSYSWFVLGLADLRGLGPEFSAESLKLKHLSAPDRWEAADLTFITPSEEAFSELTRRSGHRGCVFAGAETTLVRLATEVPRPR